MIREDVIGKNILILRIETGYSQEQLANLAGCSQKAISRYERGEVQNLSYELLKSISNVFGVTIEYLEDENNVKM